MKKIKDWDTHFVAIGIGAVEIFVVMTIFLGDLSAVAMIVAMAVVCTFGVGLLLALPVLWILGTVTLLFVDLIRPGGRDHSATAAGSKGTSYDALIAYVARARSQELSDETIRRRTLAAGWRANDIDAAIRDLPASGAAST